MPARAHLIAWLTRARATERIAQTNVLHQPTMLAACAAADDLSTHVFSHASNHAAMLVITDPANEHRLHQLD